MLSKGNEIRFEDMTGAEELFVQAEKDMNVLVKGDQGVTIGGARALTVTGTEVVSVVAGRTTNISVADTTTVIGPSSLAVTGNRTVVVTGEQSESTTGSRSVQVEGDESRTIEGNAELTMKGAQTIQIGGDQALDVIGNVESATTGSHHESFADDFVARHAGHHVVIVGGPDSTPASAVHIEGSANIYVGDTLEVDVKKAIKMRCGKSEIVVTPDAISVTSPTITFGAGDALNLRANNILAAGGDSIGIQANKVTVASSGASVALDSNATVHGSKVQLQGGGGASAWDQPDQKKETTIVAVDSVGHPLPLVRAILRTGGEGGPERSVVLDMNGSHTVSGANPFDVAFPDHPDSNSLPGEMAPYVIRQGDHLSKLAARRNFDADRIWKHPKNTDLRQSRPDPHILAAGDVLYIPTRKLRWQPANVGSTNQFTLENPTIKLKSVFASHGKPLVNEPFTVIELPSLTGRTTDGQGTITLDVPPLLMP